MLTTNTRRPSKGFKYEDFRLLFLQETKIALLGLGPRARWRVPKKGKPTPLMTSPTKKRKSKTSQLLCIRASIPLLVLDGFYKLHCFYVNIFSPYCFHYMVALLLYSYFRGLCAFACFHHRQKCLLRFVLGYLHVSLTSR